MEYGTKVVDIPNSLSKIFEKDFVVFSEPQETFLTLK